MTTRNDFPDFGTAPTFLTYNSVSYSTASPSPLATFDCSSYQYGMLYISEGAAAGVDATLAFEWMGAVGNEGNIAITQNFVRLAGGTIVIPFQVVTPTLQIRVIDAASSPATFGIGLTLFTGPPYQHGYPGGIFAINDNRTIVMAGTDTLIPAGCGPGLHVFNIWTDSVSWDAVITIYPDRLQPIIYEFQTAHSGALIDTQFTLPATQWTLDLTNNGVDALFITAVSRTPNPN